jgi:hypothetical protein
VFFWGTVITCLCRDARLFARSFPPFHPGDGRDPDAAASPPYLANADDPKAQPIIGVFFVIFLIGATLQALRLLKASVPLGLDRGDERL